MRTISILIVVVLASVSSICAQTTSLRGTVVDDVGAVVPGAKVTFRLGENFLFETSADDKGMFIANVRTGLYSIEVRATGFMVYSVDDYRVPNVHVAEIPQIVLQSDKKWPRFEDLPLLPEFPVYSGKPFLDSKISTRPIPGPLFPATNAQNEKPDNSGRSTFCADIRNDFGGLIPHVKVELIPTKRSSAHQTYTFFTDNDGNLRTEVLNGIYKITFSKESFRLYVIKETALPSSPTECLGITLKSAVLPHQIT